MLSDSANWRKKGMRSRRTVSLGSSNHELTATAFSGWNMYEAGELSTMMHSLRLLPSRLRSWVGEQAECGWRLDLQEHCSLCFFKKPKYLDVVAAMEDAVLAEESVSKDALLIEMVRDRVGVLWEDGR